MAFLRARVNTDRYKRKPPDLTGLACNLRFRTREGHSFAPRGCRLREAAIPGGFFALVQQVASWA